MEKNKKKKLCKKILLTLTLIAVVFSVVAFSANAIQASIGVMNDYRPSIPLVSIQLHNNLDTIGGVPGTVYDITLSDYLSFSVDPASPRYMTQVPALPQLNGYPSVSNVQNLFTTLGKTFAKDFSSNLVSAYADSYQYQSSSIDKKFCNPFNSETVTFNFGDFVLLNDPDNYSIWCYEDILSPDQFGSYYILEFTAYFKDINGHFTPSNFYVDYPFVEEYFTAQEFNYRGNNRVALNYDNFYRYFVENDVTINTEGFYISDCRFKASYTYSDTSDWYCTNAGYYSNLVNSDSAYVSYFNSNPIIKTEFVGIGDISFTEWLTVAIGGFFDFEFIPGVSLGGLLLTVITVGILMLLIRIFRG